MHLTKGKAHSIIASQHTAATIQLFFPEIRKPAGFPAKLDPTCPGLPPFTRLFDRGHAPTRLAFQMNYALNVATGYHGSL
jgi:hypothetical protein